MLQIFKKRLSVHNPPNNLHVSKKASVLIPVFEKDEELYILLTRRADTLRSHSGEVSFPGGKQDSTDLNAEETALRESFEEIGLPQNQVTIIGKLDQILSKDFLLVTPIIGMIPADFVPFPNLSEIESVFHVPLTFFMEGKTHHSTPSKTTKPFLIHHFYFNEYDIWGMTALLILRLIEIGLDYAPSYPVHHSYGPTWMDFSQHYREEHQNVIKKEWQMS